jgi:4-amino-4-deoxy-L-arabinose transferase-like glycosyltransferase
MTAFCFLRQLRIRYSIDFSRALCQEASVQRGAVWLIVALSVAVRLWQIDAPFDDLWSWRQSDVAAIARNYFENGFHFSRPQIDWAGGEAGFVGTEFPILPFVAALLYNFFGPHEWIGRVLTIAFFAASLPFVFLLTERAFDKSAAILALVFYFFAPVMWAASRAFIPDVPSLTCALGGLYFFWRWLDGMSESSSEGRTGGDETRPRLFWFAAAILIALSLMLKPTTATLAAPMAALAWRKFGRGMLLQPSLWLFALLALTPPVWWFWHAYMVAREFYPHHMFGAGGIRLMNPDWYWEILRLTFVSSLTPLLFLLAIIGLFRPVRTSAFHWWLGAMLFFIIVVGYGNRHEWYRLPLVPIAAAFAGAAVSSLARRTKSLAAAGIILFLFSAALQVRHYLAPTAGPLLQLARELHECTSPGALIIAADDGDPAVFYYAHRKGWHFLERDGIYDGNPSDSEQLIADLKILRARGATHVAFYRATTWWLDYYPGFAEYLARISTPVKAAGQVRIYQLKKE